MRLVVVSTVVLLVAHAALALPLSSQQCASIDVSGHFRKDNFLPYKDFPEYKQPDPVDGGRVHLVATLPGAVAPPLSSVQINGVEAINLTVTDKPDVTYFDWARTFVDAQSNQALITFHSRNRNWLDTPGASLKLTLTDSNGTCWEGTYVPQVSNVYVTWVTPLDNANRRWIAHLHNDGNSTVSVTSIKFDGIDVASPAPSLSSLLLAARGGHTIVTFQVAAAKPRGQLYTIRVEFAADLDSAVTVANGAKTPDIFFPIEVWPRSDDCPVPSGNANNWNELRSHGVDTVYYSRGSLADKCKLELTEVIEADFAAGCHYWTDTKGAASLAPNQTSLLSAILIADEDDGDDSDLRGKLSEALSIDAAMPNVLSYQGGKTNRHDGEYAGLADIQGVDAYAAACAPTIISAIKPMPLLGPYMYLRNTRNNQMPLPSMTYSQLYGDWQYEPNGDEIAFQMASVALAGSKGITLFQSVQQYFDQNRKDWDVVVGDVLRSLGSTQLRHVLRTGDVDSLQLLDGSDNAAVTAIRNHENIVFVVANTHAKGYSSSLCHVDLEKHWKWSPHTLSKLKFARSADIASVDTANLTEISFGKAATPSDAAAFADSDHIELRNVALGGNGDKPVRFFVLPYAMKA